MCQARGDVEGITLEELYGEDVTGSGALSLSTIEMPLSNPLSTSLITSLRVRLDY